MVVRARGHDRRGNGTATATSPPAFTETGNITDIQVLTDLSITGRPAQFGGGVISDVSDRLLDLFVNCVSARFTDGEFATDLREVDGEPTIEIPGRRTGGSDRARRTPDRSGRGRRRTSTRSAESRSTQPHLQVIGTLVPVVLKRYWPVLLGRWRGHRDRAAGSSGADATGESSLEPVVVNVCVALHRDGRWLLTVRGPKAAHAPDTDRAGRRPPRTGPGDHECEPALLEADVLENNARREVLEETGVDLGGVALVYLGSEAFRSDAGHAVLVVTFVAEVPPGSSPGDRPGGTQRRWLVDAGRIGAATPAAHPGRLRLCRQAQGLNP